MAESIYTRWDHLGIGAGICQQIDLAEQVDHEVASYGRKGRPAVGEVTQKVGWRVQGEVMERPEAILAAEKGLGQFILATNELDEERLPAEEMLEAYKGQGVGPERGFRFLKDPWFFADSLFLQSPKRMMALAMGLGLALWVYALAEHRLRTALRERGESVPNQVGKPPNVLRCGGFSRCLKGLICC